MNNDYALNNFIVLHRSIMVIILSLVPVNIFLISSIIHGPMDVFILYATYMILSLSVSFGIYMYEKMQKDHHATLVDVFLVILLLNIPIVTVILVFNEIFTRDREDKPSFKHYFQYMIGRELFFIIVDKNDNRATTNRYISGDDVKRVVTADKKLYAMLLLTYA